MFRGFSGQDWGRQGGSLRVGYFVSFHRPWGRATVPESAGAWPWGDWGRWTTARVVGAHRGDWQGVCAHRCLLHCL